MAGDPSVSWAGARVVMAATELTWSEKAVWLAIFGLSREGCYMSVTLLAQRIGLSTEHVEKTRGLMKRAKLLSSAPRPGVKGETWWVTLPPGCTPTSRRPRDDEVFRLARLLDDVVRAARPYRDTTKPPPLSSTAIPPNGRNSVVPPYGHQGDREGGKGGASTLSPSTLQEVGTTPPTSPPPSDAGTFASEQEDEVGPSSDSDSAGENEFRNWIRKNAPASTPTRIDDLIQVPEESR
jgi:hypothetical protein